MTNQSTKRTILAIAACLVLSAALLVPLQAKAGPGQGKVLQSSVIKLTTDPASSTFKVYIA